MPLRSYGSFINNTVEFINQVIKVAIAPADMKACHPLGPINFEGQTAVIAKLIYFDQKEKIAAEKLFEIYCHPTNKKPVYISERHSKFDVQLKEAAETECISVSMKKSAPIVHVDQEDIRTQHVINSFEDVMEQKNQAIKKK